MIQRIQSVYLFLASLLPALTFFAPVATLSADNGQLSISSAYFEAANYPLHDAILPWGMLIMASILILVNLGNIFCYKNRKKQIRLADCGIAATLLFYAASIYHILVHASETNASVSVSAMFFAPLIGLVFILLARHAIKSDEALVRAADRIR